MLGGLYGQSLALLTDFYQLTMAAAAWKSGMEDREAVFHLLFRRTLFATKAARVCLAAQGEPVIEFGLRRAQGIDGAVSAARAAYIGGCAATSDVLAGKLLGIPVRGTHAHSWVMLFDSEREAFAAYA